MQWLKKALLNPFLLAAQGFLAGAVLFVATHPEVTGREDAARTPVAAPAER